MDKLFSFQDDYLPRYPHLASLSMIAPLRHQLADKIKASNLAPYREAIESLRGVRAKIIDLSQDYLKIGHPDELDPELSETLDRVLTTFIPWKKGPFEIFGRRIDSEWRSDLKWNRIRKNIGSLEGKKIADIGCNNGYFMFRMAAEGPEIVIGLEPYAKNFLNFQLIQQFCRQPNIYFELLGAEHIHYYEKFFDTVFCLGILYHQTDPIAALRKIFQSLQSGGEVIIDCQGIPGDDSMTLVPAGRYAQARGIWSLPTLTCLKTWLRRTQFRDIECFYNEPLSIDEQRTTEWAPVSSLKDFLDPEDPHKTIEGYPAPRRFYVKARR